MFFVFFFFFNDTATTEIYTLSLHDALPIFDALDELATLARPASGSRLAVTLAKTGDSVVSWTGR